MKIKDGYILRHIADTDVIVPVGERVIGFKGIMTLTGITPYVWSILEKGASREDLYSMVIEEYNVPPEQARQDIDDLLNKMFKLGLIDNEQ